MNSRLLASVPFLAAALAAQGRPDAKLPPSPPPLVDADQKTPEPPRPSKPVVATLAPRVAPAAAPAKAPVPAQGVAALARMPEDAVLVDRPGDGRVWVRTRSYKAAFDARGAEYIPFLGATAPRNYPVQFHLRRVRAGGVDVAFKTDGAVTTSDQRVAIDRGSLIERYDLAAKSVEQSFVFASLPAAGDLVLEIGVATELEARVDGERLDFANDLGRVEYGAAFLVDADGRRAPMQRTWREGAIELRADAAFLATARFPVTVDPIVNSFTATATGLVEFGADIAYDITPGVYLVVWEDAFSATDHDVASVLRLADGSLVAGSFVYIDQTSDHWVHPKVADLRQQSRFLVVAERGAAPNRQIWGRTRNADNSTEGNQFEVSANGGSGDKCNPDVGGDANYWGAVYWTVVWQRNLSASDSDIHAQQVGALSLLIGGAILIDNSSGTLDHNPAISKSDGDEPAGSQDWTIVWQRTYNSNDEDIYFAQVHWDGAITRASGVLDNSGINHTHPVVSSPTDVRNGSRYNLVCFEGLNSGGDHDIIGVLLKDGVKVVTRNLSLMDDNGTVARDQLTPRVDSDGARFLVAFAEQYGGNDWDVRASTYHLVYGANLGVSEARVAVGYTGYPELRPGVTSTRSAGGAITRYGMVWDQSLAAGNMDVLGAILDGTGNGGFSSVPTGCNGLAMLAGGSTALGGQANFQMTGSGLNVPILMFSLPAAPVTVCSTCQLGVNLNLASFIPGSVLGLQIPLEGAFVGGTLAVQGFTFGVGPCLGQVALSDTALFTIR